MAKAKAKPDSGGGPSPKGKAGGRKPKGRGDSHRRLMAERSREDSRETREIGPLPDVVNWERRNRGLVDPEFFHKTYFPNRFYLEFGDPHKDAIRTLADCTEDGGLFAFAMMRGGGKTVLSECEVMRAILNALRRYVVLIGATDGLAGKALKRIFREFETNDLLFEDFPEVCWPIRALERITQRARGQTLNGESTLMEITDGHLVLPTVRGSASSGAVIQSFGLTGALKGLNLLSPDGTPIRPDMVVIDDAQTRESAKSPTQTEDRERIICDDVLGLAGPRTKMAAVFLCTPIYPNDLTERFISRERHPEWQGVRTRMIETFPTNLALWDEYSEVRRESLRAGDKGARGNEFYLKNQAAMDAGCVLAWPERVTDGDISGIQSAMNRYYTNPTGFQSEFQCEPEKAQLGAGAKEIVPAEVAARTNGVERHSVPSQCTRLTAFVDVGGELLWYAVCGWNESFGGAVVDYGCWPRQTRTLFAASDPRPGMSDIFAGHSEEQRVFAGLKALIPEICAKTYYSGPSEFRVERCLIDAGWKPDAVAQSIRSSPHSAMLLASKGVGRSTEAVGVAKWKLRQGERSGYHWRLTAGIGGRGRQVQFDPDAWKSFIYSALHVPPGGPTGLTLFGKSAGAHEMLSEHMAAEYSQPVTLRGDTFDKWSLKPGIRDNHLLDCVVGCAVAASVGGLTWQADGGAAKPVEVPKPTAAPRPGERKRIQPVRR